MEQLKIAIADKILEASAGDSEQMRNKLRKIQRFSDFSEALKSMMQKYPEIEEELLRMVNDDDFDTAKASRRVDYILNKEHTTPIAESFPAVETTPSEPEIVVLPPPEVILPEEDVTFSVEEEIVEEESVPLTDDEFEEDLVVEEEVIIPPYTPEEEVIIEEVIPPYIPEEEPEKEEEIVYSTLGEDEPEMDDENNNNRKLVFTIVKIALVIGLLVALYFIIKEYWEYILAGIGVVLLAFVGWKYYKNKKSRTP